MTLPSDTPPNGDFAAYIERLTGTPGGDAAQDLFEPQADIPADIQTGKRFGIGKRFGVGKKLGLGAAMPSLKALPQTVSNISVVDHLKWLLVILVATQALSLLVPGAGFLFIPVLLAYAGWMVARLKQDTSATLAEHLRSLAQQIIEKAIEQAQKPPHFPKNKL